MHDQSMIPQSTQGVKELMLLQAKLFKKIHTVVSKVEKIEKSGFNKHQNYHYSTEQDLVNAVRNLLLENNIVILTDSETKEVIKINKPDGKGGNKESLVSIVNTRHTFCDTESGATYSVQSTGSGWDETDKFVYKSLTGAFKYFLAKNFLVATEDDPENDGITKPITTTPTKGFSRSATAQAANITTSEAPKSEVVEPPKVINDTPKVVEKRPEPTTIAKPSFGRRLTTVKNSEPNFP